MYKRQGDVGIRAEGAVLEALDPAQPGNSPDILLGPVSADVGEGLGGAAGTGIKPGANGGKLSPRDGGLGIKGSTAMTLHDAQTRHGGDGGICPVRLSFFHKGEHCNLLRS